MKVISIIVMQLLTTVMGATTTSTTTTPKNNNIDNDDDVLNMDDILLILLYMDDDTATNSLLSPPHRLLQRRQYKYQENKNNLVPLQQPILLETIQTWQSSMWDNTVDLPRVARPTFWHIPKAGGTYLQDFTTRCLGLVGASEVGHLHQDQTLFIFEERDNSQFVNVDLSQRLGLQHAQELNFASSGLAQVVFPGQILESVHYLNSPQHQASLFTIMRHPIERQVSLFYYLGQASWEKHSYHPEWHNMTLLEYLQGGNPIERDWMVRQLTGRYHEELNERDLQLAKDLLRTKVWIGLLDQIETSLERFGIIFSWNQETKHAEQQLQLHTKTTKKRRKQKTSKRWKECIKKFNHHASNQHEHPKIKRMSKEWKLLEKYNHWDIQLYQYAVELFDKQEELVQDLKMQRKRASSGKQTIETTNRN